MQEFGIDKNIRRASTLHSDFYTKNDSYEAAKESVFAPSWQLVGHADQLAQNGAVQPVTLLDGYMDEPLLLVKDSEGTTRCMSNVCTHRGNLLVKHACTAAHQLRCKYHGRQFSLDGKFRSMPEFKDVSNFPSAADDLHVLSLHQWGKFLFTSLEPAEEASAYLATMQERMHWYPVQNLKFRADLSKDYTVAAHWALYCENYLEGFHIPFVHEGLNKELDFGEYTTETFRYSNLQLGIGKNGDECFDLPPSSADYGKQVAAYYFWVFPNMMFNFYPWGVSVNLVQPLGLEKTKVSFLSFVLDEEKLGQGAGAELDTVELEDEEVVEAVQRGIRSRFYTQGRYAPEREQGTHHFHSLLAEFMNKVL